MNLGYALFVMLLSLAWLLLPIIALVIAFRMKEELRGVRYRLDALETGLGAGKKIVDVVGREARASTAEATVAAPSPTVSAAAPTSTAAPIPVPSRIPEGAPVPSRKHLDSARLEQLVGGIWLQNVGSVLLLLGTFFLILWGYTKGKIGPEILVAAGVLLGALLAWRGDRIARTLRPLGHAFLGVGLGVVYITLYLGHFRMGVLSEWVTFALLSLLSFLTVDIGLRRAQAVIASLGVLGAFVPLLLTPMSGSGFHLSLPALLGYFAVVNGVVFALTAARGWSGLVIMALLLTTMTWVIHTSHAVWGLPIQLGLSALYTVLGMVPVVRLARSPNRVRGVDLAVVAMAPMLLLLATLPYFAARKGVTTGGLLASLGSVNLIAALWVDVKRSERDLWRPLTAAATIFFAAALERLLANEYLSLAWCVEGASLVWLGLAPRGGWIRGLGYGVSLLALWRLLITPASYDPVAGGGIGIFTGAALRDILCIAVLMIVTASLWSRRSMLGENDRRSPEIALIAANIALLSWTAREAGHMASVIARGGATAPNLDQTTAMVAAGITCAAWILQAGALLTLGWARGSAFVRWTGLGLVGVTLAKFVLFDLQRVDVFWRFVIALGVGAVLLVFSFVYQRRARGRSYSPTSLTITG